MLNLQRANSHHGIDWGDVSVIHYRKPSEIVERTSLETFARGGKIYVVRHVEVGFSFIPDVVVER
ncbi:MAG: NC domain-containing protein, partial [Microcystis panniformis]